MSVYTSRLKDKIFLTIGKRSGVIMDEYIMQYEKELHDVISRLKPYIVTTFLSVPYDRKTRNTSQYPRKRTGNLIRSLSYVIRKSRTQTEDIKLTKRHVQYTITQLWDDNLTKMKRPVNGISSYGELLNVSRKFKQRGYKTTINDKARNFIENRVKGFT